MSFIHSKVVVAGTEVWSKQFVDAPRTVVVRDYDTTKLRHNAFVLLAFAKADSNGILCPRKEFAFSILADRFEQEFEIINN